MNYLVTGGTGFIGSALIDGLELSGGQVFALVRSGSIFSGSTLTNVIPFDSLHDCNLIPSVFIDTVFHLAGLAHVANAEDADALVKYREINIVMSENLARQAIAAGVRRFVFLSSISVNSAGTCSEIITEKSEPNPAGVYAVSKFEAEQRLFDIFSTVKTELVVIRPPLVYGRNARGNFAKLLGIVERGLPLPFGSIKNKRSLIALENLVDFMCLCAVHPAAADQVFVISDGIDLSIGEIIRFLSISMGIPLRIFPFPPYVLRFLAKAVGKQRYYDKVCGNLSIDISKAVSLMGWSPVISPEVALTKVGMDYRR